MNINNIVIIVLFCICMSILGTMIGAFIGISVKKTSKELLGFILAISAGLMLTISTFELIPEAIDRNGMKNFLQFFILGISLILIISYFSNFYTKNNHIKTAFLVSLGLMLHNFPEGLIMGFGFITAEKLGIKMSILIAIHDIPEGLSVALPLKYSKIDNKKIVTYVFLTAFPALIGSLIGIFVGSISSFLVGISLALASGIMIYVVLFQIVPESRELLGVKYSSLGILIGCIIGVFMILFI